MSDMKRLEEKVDKLDSRLDKIDLHLAKYNKELEFHVARTDELQDMVVPVHKWYLQWQGVGNAVMWVSVIAGIIGAMAWLWSR